MRPPPGYKQLPVVMTTLARAHQAMLDSLMRDDAAPQERIVCVAYAVCVIAEEMNFSTESVLSELASVVAQLQARVFLPAKRRRETQ